MGFKNIATSYLLTQWTDAWAMGVRELCKDAFAYWRVLIYHIKLCKTVNA